MAASKICQSISFPKLFFAFAGAKEVESEKEALGMRLAS